MGRVPPCKLVYKRHHPHLIRETNFAKYGGPFQVTTIDTSWHLFGINSSYTTYSKRLSYRKLKLQYAAYAAYPYKAHENSIFLMLKSSCYSMVSSLSPLHIFPIWIPMACATRNCFCSAPRNCSAIPRKKSPVPTYWDRLGIVWIPKMDVRHMAIVTMVISYS